MKKIMRSVWNYLYQSWILLATNLAGGVPDDAEEEPGSHYIYH